MTSVLTNRTPFKNVTYESSKPDTVPPILERTDNNGKFGNSHVFHGVEQLDPSVPVPGKSFYYEQEGHFIHGLSGNMEKSIDVSHYKIKRRGETKQNDEITVSEMAEIEAPLYQIDLSNLTGQLFGLQILPKIDKNKQLMELKDSTRGRDAEVDSGTTGGGLAHFDYQGKFMTGTEETKEDDNPYQALSK